MIAAEELAGLPIDLPPPPKLPGRDFDVKGALGDLRTRHARKKELREWNADRVLELVRVTGMDHALVNAETMLLIDDYQPEAPEFYTFLEKRMSADDQLRRTVCD